MVVLEVEGAPHSMQRPPSRSKTARRSSVGMARPASTAVFLGRHQASGRLHLLLQAALALQDKRLDVLGTQAVIVPIEAIQELPEVPPAIAPHLDGFRRLSLLSCPHLSLDHALHDFAPRLHCVAATRSIRPSVQGSLTSCALLSARTIAESYRHVDLFL